jgi:hypothetical protein
MNEKPVRQYAKEALSYLILVDKNELLWLQEFEKLSSSFDDGYDTELGTLNLCACLAFYSDDTFSFVKYLH